MRRTATVFVACITAVAAIGAGDLMGWKFRLTGIVVYPDGSPAGEATVTAMTFCNPDDDRYHSRDIVSSQSHGDGSFTLEGFVERCSRLKLQVLPNAQKRPRPNT